MSDGILLLLRIGLVLFVGIVCWWGGVFSCFGFFFVDQNAQSKLVGKYYVKSFVKTIFAIMSMKVCLHYMYLVCFQSGGGGEMAAVVVEAVTLHCLKIYQERKAALVGKIHVYCLSLLPFE